MPKQAVLELIADASKLKSTLKSAEGDTDRFGSKMGALGGIIAGALSGAALLKFGSDSAQAFNESEQAQSKLELALKNSSATVGLHAADFAKLNSELAKHTLADDDVIAATEAQMVTFGASRQQIEQMIPTVLDFAAKMGIDAPAAADLFDKASLGSVRALKTLGIEGFKPSGDKAKDLASIQDLLKDKVKGAAQAQLDAAGPGATMKKSMDELQETVGKYLVPALSKIAEVGVTVMDFFAGHPVIMAMVGAVGALAAGIWIVNTATALFAAEGAIATAATSVWAAAQWVLNAALTANPIGLIIAAIVALVAIIVVAYKNSETFRDIVNGAFTAVKNVVMGVYNWVKDNWPLLLAILTGPIGLAVLAIITHWDTIKNAFTAVKDWISDRIGDIVGFFTGLPGRIAGAASNMFDGIKDAFRGAINWIIGKWNNLRLTIGGNTFDLPGPLGSITIPSMSLDTPNIPYLHAGGVVPGAPGSDVLAMLQGGERVIPRGGTIGAGGGTTVIQLTLDGKTVTELVFNGLLEKQRRSGALGLT
jgi:hypothetical protein